MRVLLTGANGYIGRRLLPLLLQAGHEVHCVVRSRSRFGVESDEDLGVHVHEADLLDPLGGAVLPTDVDAAYYLVHGLASGRPDGVAVEERAAREFATHVATSGARQVIYLSGLGDDRTRSEHLASRRRVERVLREGPVPVTVLRSGLIVGSGSASFEIIRDLVEKLPVMFTPRWVRSRAQPIAVRDVLGYLVGVLGHDGAIGETLDIGGPEALTFQSMLERYGAIRDLNRVVLPMPLVSPLLSAYWLYLVTSTSFPLARGLAESMAVDVVCRDERIRELVPRDLLTYDEAVRLAFERIEQRTVDSSWIDALGTGNAPDLEALVQVPRHGVYRDVRESAVDADVEEVVDRLWRIGGSEGWYFAEWLWGIRGLLDRFVGGTGLRRGRRHPSELRSGDALDFWRVLVANREAGRLLLYAEMRLPGEAWLEFEIDRDGPAGPTYRQSAVFRPRGLLGRAYWYAVTPLHAVVFGGLLRSIVRPGGERTPE